MTPPSSQPALSGASANAPELTFRWLGRIAYAEALTLQDTMVQQRRSGEMGDTVLMLEHEPVYTIGRTRDRSSLRNPDSLPHPVVEINRGGQATWHGPGQLVGYLIMDLRAYGCDLHTYLRALEEAQITWLQNVGISGAGRREGLTGVWIGDRKISSIGVGVRHWISMHGFALNVSRDLSGFDAIVPCGISNVEMTSVERESDRDWTPEQVATGLHDHLRREMSTLAT